MNILITGGTGLLGGRLVEFFSKTNNVKSTSRKRKNKFLHIDWKSLKNINKICKNVDVIIHAAGPSYKDCVKNPKSANNFYSNVTKEFIKSASISKVKLFIFISSTQVYKNNKYQIMENHKSYSNHPYAKANLIGERKVLNEIKEDSMKRIILRISNGAGCPVEKETRCWHLATNDLCKKAITTKKILLKTNGKQYRNFIPISEICRVIKFIIGRKISNKKNIINIVSNKPQKLIDIAKIIKLRYQKIFKKKIEIIKSKKKDNKKYVSIKSNFLKNNNLNISSNLINEIDQLLRFCKKNFRFKN